MPRLKNLFYVDEIEIDRIHRTTAIVVKHRRAFGPDQTEAIFNCGKSYTTSKTRARKAAKAFCKQMNAYYPTKVKID